MEERIASLALPDVTLEETALPASLQDPPPDGRQSDQPAAAPVDEQVQKLPATESSVAPGAGLQPAVQVPALRKIVFTAGAAPFISTFAAAKYFDMGLSVTLAGQYRLRTAGGFLGLGGTTGVHWFEGKGAYASARFHLVPIGPDVWYGTLTGSPIDFFAHVNGGAAVFLATLSSGNTLAKVVSYVQGGVGVNVSIAEAIGVSIESSYAAYFDSPDPIMVYTPTFLVCIRL